MQKSEAYRGCVLHNHLKGPGVVWVSPIVSSPRPTRSDRTFFSFLFSLGSRPLMMCIIILGGLRLLLHLKSTLGLTSLLYTQIPLYN